MAVYRCQSCNREYTKPHEICPFCGSNPMMKLGTPDDKVIERRKSITSWTFLISLVIALVIIFLAVAFKITQIS